MITKIVNAYKSLDQDNRMVVWMICMAIVGAYIGYAFPAPM